MEKTGKTSEVEEKIAEIVKTYMEKGNWLSIDDLLNLQDSLSWYGYFLQEEYHKDFQAYVGKYWEYRSLKSQTWLRIRHTLVDKTQVEVEKTVDTDGAVTAAYMERMELEARIEYLKNVNWFLGKVLSSMQQRISWLKDERSRQK